MVEDIHLTTSLPDPALKRLEGEYAEESHFARVVETDANVIRPNGSLLCSLWSGVAAGWDRAWPAVLSAARPTNFRKTAQGTAPLFLSGTFGYKDGRPTRFNLEQARKVRSVLPLLLSMERAFRDARPREWEAHRDRVRRLIPAECFAGDTGFTTFAANRHRDKRRSARMAYHYDDGNLDGALGLLAFAGDFSGGLLGFPRFGVALRVKPGDVVIADNHELHGNTPIIGHRVSLVAYVHASNVRS